jgi:hypothetical protein
VTLTLRITVVDIFVEPIWRIGRQQEQRHRRIWTPAKEMQERILRILYRLVNSTLCRSNTAQSPIYGTVLATAKTRVMQLKPSIRGWKRLTCPGKTFPEQLLYLFEILSYHEKHLLHEILFHICGISVFTKSSPQLPRRYCTEVSLYKTITFLRGFY